MRFPGYENTKFIKGIPEGWEVKRVGDLGKCSDPQKLEFLLSS